MQGYVISWGGPKNLPRGGLIVVDKKNHKKNIEIPSIIDLIVQVHKGCPSKEQRESSSTKRDQSKFEIMETNRCCSTCKGIGHNNRTCQIKARAHNPGLDGVGSTMENMVSFYSYLPIMASLYY